VDELDRLFGLLVAALARETRVAVPFPASDVYERLVPYRANRARLNVATHQDYEMAVLRLLAGERNYVQLEPEDELLDTTGENPIPPAAQPLTAHPPPPPVRPSRFRVARPPDMLSEQQCEYCGGVLPTNRDVRFCPHCGQPQEGDLKCAGCSSPLDVGWAYCLACGRPTGFE